MGRKKDYKVKYVGESGRSGYERGNEHINSFKNMEETSHLLKHYLIFHKDIKMEEMKYGMRIRSVFQNCLERQVGEALVIDIEQRKKITLMNSKSEYNRCKLPRISTRNHSEHWREEKEESEEDSILKKEILKLRIEK